MRAAPFLLLLVLLTVSMASAQAVERVPESCTTLLDHSSKLGPSELKSTESGLWLFYEDRVSRQPLRAAMVNTTNWHDLLEDCGVLGVSPQRFGLSLPLFLEDGQVLPQERLSGVPRIQSGPFIDLEIELLYNFAIDYWVDWFRDRIAIGPKIKVWWPNGLVMSAQYAFPIRNQLPEIPAKYWSKPYPNELLVGFRKQLGPQWIGGVSSGFYERNRYGSEVQLYWMSRRWPVVLGGRAGMTGYWSLYEGNFETEPVNTFMGYLDATVYLPWYNLRMRGRTGHFSREKTQFERPGEDIKIRVGTTGEVTRMFGEVEIGLHAFYDGFVVYPGFRFAAPLSPSKGLKKGRVAVYPTRQIQVPYDLGRVVRGKLTGFVRPKRGELHRSGIDVWDDLRFLNANMSGNFE